MPKIVDEIPMEKLVSRQMRVWEQTTRGPERDVKPAFLPTLAVSREIGSLGTDLARRISAKLDWQLYDRELVELIANNAKVRKQIVESFDEKTQGELHNWVFTLLDRHALGIDRYFKHLLLTIISIGERGNAIVLGRGCNYILSPERTLRLKIVASFDFRVKNMMKKKDIPEREAESMIKTVDNERLAFNRRFFHTDDENPLNYDIVINLGNLGLAAAEEIVVMALTKKFGGDMP
jgi:cytidylate kinase